MGVFLRCKSCNSDLYSTSSKNELQFPTSFTCHLCRNANQYDDYEIQEERYNFRCIICSGNFHAKRSLPLQVLCPHCKSVLYLNSDGTIGVVQQKPPPVTTKQSTAGGTVGGLVLGGLIGGPIGALLGAIAGGAIGSTQDNPECEYL